MKDYYAPIVEHLVFPAAQMLNRCNYWAKLREARLNQSLSREQIRELQFKKLGEMLYHAYQHVPYYCDLFNQMRITPADIRTWSDFEQLPILTRADVRQNRERLKSRKPRGPQRRYSTSGSTGTPLIVFTSQVAIAAEYACIFRALEHWGIRMGDRTVHIRGDDFTIVKPGLSFWVWQKFKVPIKDRLFNRRNIPVNTITGEKLEAQWRLIEKFKPTYLSGYPSAIYLLAKKINDLGRDGSSVGLKLVGAGGEILTDQYKSTLAEVFNCPVTDMYGSFEIGIAAHLLPCGAMHINDDFVILEVIRSNPQNEFGEVVATRLDNWEFPLIRYNTEDYAAPLSPHRGCSLGLNFQIIDKIIGRKFGLVRFSDGRALHGNFFIDMLEYTPGVRQYQIHQRELDRFEILVVIDPGFDFEKAESHIHDRLRAMIGQVDASIVHVDSIPFSPSGKFHVVRSELRE